jgi:hypothetical protein
MSIFVGKIFKTNRHGTDKAFAVGGVELQVFEGRQQVFCG